MRGVAERVLAKARASEVKGDELLQRLVGARDPASGEAMPDRLIVDNVVTFLIAGHETTSQALTWSLYLLALFPEWQEKLREEAAGVAGHPRNRARGHRQASLARRGVPGGDADCRAGIEVDAAERGGLRLFAA